MSSRLPVSFFKRSSDTTETIFLSFIGAVIFILVYVLLYVWRTGAAPCDIEAHARMAPIVISGEKKFPNIGFYGMVMLLALGKTDTHSLVRACYIMLASAVVLKWTITQQMLRKWLIEDKMAGRLGFFAPLLAVVLLLCMNYHLPGEAAYLGKFPPNIWHNTTTIVMLPAALILFSLSLSFLTSPNPLTAYKIAGMITTTALLKPSFLFCFVPAFSIMVIFCHANPKSSHFSMRAAAYGLTLPLLASVIIGLQALYLYGSNHASGVDIAPFVVWHSFTPHCILALFFSITFPLFVVLLFLKDSIRDLRLQFSWLLFLAALAAFILLAERQERRFDGNFVWQVISANYLLFLSSVGFLLSKAHTAVHKKLAFGACGLILCGHLAYGIKYLAVLTLRHQCF